ncbi:MAG: polysaccharide biosynthesis tyrosine autokinase [Bacteroidales bacterium]|nr:polysaccharide biosynthesis tyrosine autokinase [Bacteroidales bacterium]
MTSTHPPKPSPRPQSDDIDLLKYFYLFLGNWYWFALALLISFATVRFVNRNSPKIYKVMATMLIEDQSSNPYSMTPSMFGGDLTSGFGLYPSWYNFQNQILILKSESLVSRTLHDLDFEVSYYKDEILGPREMLNEVPFVIVPDFNKLQPLGVMFTVTVNGNGAMKLESEVTGEKVTLYNYLTQRSSDGPAELNIDRPVHFGETIEGEGYSFTFLPRNENTKPETLKSGTWLFKFNSFEGLIAGWSNALNIKPLDEEASIVSIEVSTACPAKAQMFINKHLEMYLQRTLDKKNLFATNTINFIDRQLVSIADSLDITEINLQNYRRNNQVVDLSFQAQRLFEQTKELDNEKAQLKMKEDYFRYLINYLAQNREAGDLVAPSVMGIDDPLLNNLVLELNRMADQKIAMSGSGVSANPYLSTLESQIRNAKARLEENTQNLLNNNTLAMREVDRRLGTLMAEVRKLPQTERELLGIERRFKLNDNIYTYLLQRRAEAQIARASNTPDNEIIDMAKIVQPPVKPKPMRNYAIALMAGLLVPGALLVLIRELNTKVTSEEDIKRISDLPIAGHITHSLREYQTVVLNDLRSNVAETFRNLRTRLQFFTRETKSPVILITSSMPEEGKTFASINLASAYSLAGKKTVLLGFDLRKPKLYSDFSVKGEKGISTYLIGQHSLDEVIQESGYQNLWVITSGPIPPNPSELAGSEKTKEMFSELKKRFDYIICDSAPIGAVSDTISLAMLADVTIMLVRHRKTVKYILENTLNDAKANGINHISLLLNDISRDKGIYGYTGRYRYGYGYGYGYGYTYENEEVNGKG